MKKLFTLRHEKTEETYTQATRIVCGVAAVFTVIGAIMRTVDNIRNH